MASLIQQRMAIDRQRTFGTVSIVIGALFLAVPIALLAATHDPSWPELIYVVLGISWLIPGIVRRRKATRARLAFEAENGEHAGRQ